MNNTAEPAENVKPGDPYCGQCGYSLTALEESSRCPECGRAVIDVLMRHGDQVIPGRRYRSEATLFGWPILAIATGPAPGEKRGHARGIIAIGDRATGLLAMGGQARGIVAVGGLAIGVCSFGGVSIGLLTAMGGLAIGSLVWAGIGVGLVVSGGVAIGGLAVGGIAIAQYAAGGLPIGPHTVGPGGSDSETVALLGRFAWFYGPSGISVRTMFQPILALTAISFIPTTIIGLLAMFGLGRSGRGRESPGDSGRSLP